MDLSKLTPAPWQATGNELWIGNYHGHGGAWHTQIPREADAEFIVLARAAFDVMVRRDWIVNREVNGKWSVCMPVGTFSAPFRVGSLDDGLKPHDDPFTALVEADRWYCENVENK